MRGDGETPPDLNFSFLKERVQEREKIVDELVQRFTLIHHLSVQYFHKKGGVDTSRSSGCSAQRRLIDIQEVSILFHLFIRGLGPSSQARFHPCLFQAPTWAPTGPCPNPTTGPHTPPALSWRSCFPSPSVWMRGGLIFHFGF
jgi:hypothetical protein